MLHELFDVVNRDRHHGPRRHGHGGLTQRLIGGGDRPSRDDGPHGRRDRDDYRNRRSNARDDADLSRQRRQRRRGDFARA